MLSRPFNGCHVNFLGLLVMQLLVRPSDGPTTRCPCKLSPLPSKNLGKGNAAFNVFFNLRCRLMWLAMFAGLSGCKLVLVVALSSVCGVLFLLRSLPLQTLSLSLALKGLSPCRLTKMPSTLYTWLSRHSSERVYQCVSISFTPLRLYVHCHCWNC